MKVVIEDFKFTKQNAKDKRLPSRLIAY